jgi:hypothetical protein
MRKRVLVGLMVLGLVVAGLLVPAIASAGVTGTVTITAQPTYLCMTLTFNDAHDGSWDLGTVAEATTYWWDDEGGAQAAPSWALAFADCAGNITNCGSVTSDITVECADFTGGSGWNLTTGAPGANTVQVTAYMEGCASEGAGIEVDNAPTELKDSITAAQSLGVEISLETGTFTDGAAKSTTGTVFTIVTHT